MPAFKEDINNAALDVSRALMSSSVWTALGWNDVRSRYNRSKLGVFWASLSILIFVSALGPIYAKLFDVSIRDYTLHLMLGIMLWSYMSSIMMESAREYVNAANYLVSFRLSYFTLLLRVVWRNLVVFGYQLIMFFVLALFLGLPFNSSWAIIPVALLLITFAVLSIALLISVVATRFRDLSELLNNVLRLVFFVTPIMWMPNLNPDLKLVAQLNPFYHLIEIFRAPLLTGQSDLLSWVIVCFLAFIGWFIAFPIFSIYRSKISFWL